MLADERLYAVDRPAQVMKLEVDMIEHLLYPLEITEGFGRITAGFRCRHARNLAPATRQPRVYAGHMPDEDTPPWGKGERAGALLLAVLAIGLAFIAADILTGGKLTRRGCGCDDARTGD